MLVTLWVILFFLIFFSFVQIDCNRRNTVLRYSNYLLNLAFLFLILGSATFNNDWIAYTELFEGIKPTYDLLYFFGFEIFRLFDLTFSDFYSFNQIVIYLLFVYFISRFTNKYLFIIVLSILVLAGPNLSILLRYYTAFAFFLISIYYNIVKEKKTYSYFFLVLSIISHFGALILFPFLLFYKNIKIKNSVKVVLMIALLLNLFKNLLFEFLLFTGIGSFSIYIDEQSSFFGGVFALLPYIPWIFLVFKRHLYLMKNNENVIEVDKSYVFLYKLSMFSFFFFSLAISLQIVLYRYLEPFVIIWVTFLFYSIKFSISNINRYVLIIVIVISILVSLYLKYFFPIQILGSSEWLLHYLEILNSNKYEIFKFQSL